MKRILLALWFSVTIAHAGDSLQQRLEKHSLWLRRPLAEETLAQALKALSADYQKHYGEPLPIYVAVDLAQPPKPKVPQPAPPKIPGLMPGDDIPQAVLGPEAVETSVAVRAPIIELLRYFTALGGVSYTVRNDIILIHAANK